MILRNSIRPHINRKLSRSTLRTRRRNSNTKRRSARTSITALARPAGQRSYSSRTAARSQRTRHRQTRTRRGGHRRLQPQSLRTAVLLHRSHRSRSIRRINQTQRNHRQRRRRRRLLRNQPPPPPNPRRQHRRRQQHSQPDPARRNPAPKKPAHRNLPQVADRPRKAQPAKPPTRAQILQQTSLMLPPPPINQTLCSTTGAHRAEQTPAPS